MPTSTPPTTPPPAEPEQPGRPERRKASLADVHHIDGSLELPASTALRDTAAGAGSAFPRNEVRLTGRISAIGDPVTLPSGDLVVNLRLVVPREHPVGRRGAPGSGTGSGTSSGTGGGAGVDTIDVSCWTPATRRAATRVGIDGTAEVTGALRRRFFRAGGAPASRYEVEAQRIRRVRPAG